MMKHFMDHLLDMSKRCRDPKRTLRRGLANRVLFVFAIGPEGEFLPLRVNDLNEFRSLLQGLANDPTVLPVGVRLLPASGWRTYECLTAQAEVFAQERGVDLEQAPANEVALILAKLRKSSEEIPRDGVLPPGWLQWDWNFSENEHYLVLPSEAEWIFPDEVVGSFIADEMSVRRAQQEIEEIGRHIIISDIAAIVGGEVSVDLPELLRRYGRGEPPFGEGQSSTPEPVDLPADFSASPFFGLGVGEHSIPTPEMGGQERKDP